MNKVLVLTLGIMLAFGMTTVAAEGNSHSDGVSTGVSVSNQQILPALEGGSSTNVGVSHGYSHSEGISESVGPCPFMMGHGHGESITVGYMNHPIMAYHVIIFPDGRVEEFGVSYSHGMGHSTGESDSMGMSFSHNAGCPCLEDWD